MKKSHLIGALCAVAFSFISMSSHAIAVLEGRLPATPGGTDYQAYYDPAADLTWLANANAAVGSIYDTFPFDAGRMNLADANLWAAGLDVDGVTGWRLPTTLQPDLSCDGQYGSNQGSYGYHCTGSEMGNLFSNVLGGTSSRISPTAIQLHHNSNYDLFTNIQNKQYWSSTKWLSNSGYAWWFSFGSGGQDFYNTGASYNAWAVHDGDVGAAVVPVPAAVWLFGSGLLGLIGVARKKAA